MKKKLIFIVILILIILGVYYILKSSKKSDFITLFGNVEMSRVDLSFQVEGHIQDMFFEEGDKVKTGDLIATLDPKDYLAQMNSLKHKKDRLNVQKINADSNYQRQIPLCSQNITSKQECENLLNLKLEAEASLKETTEELQYAKNKLEQTRIIAPSFGVISSKLKEPGANTNPKDPLYVMYKSNPIWVRAYIGENDLGSVYLGQKAKVTFDTSEGKNLREYDATIGFISPVSEFTPKSVQTEDIRSDLVYRAKVFIDKPDDYLKSGMPASVRLIPESK